MKERHQEPTKLLLLPGEVSTHPTDPVEMRRLHYQTPGMIRRRRYLFIAFNMRHLQSRSRSPPNSPTGGGGDHGGSERPYM